MKEFNLSKRTWYASNGTRTQEEYAELSKKGILIGGGEVIWKEDVKEFIKLLKELCERHEDIWIEDIDKLSGDLE